MSWNFAYYAKQITEIYSSMETSDLNNTVKTIIGPCGFIRWNVEYL